MRLAPGRHQCRECAARFAQSFRRRRGAKRFDLPRRNTGRLREFAKRRPCKLRCDLYARSVLRRRRKYGCEKQGDKQVVVEERKSPVQTCAPEYKEKVAQVIADYVSKGPPISTAMEMPGAPDAKTAADVKTEPAQKK